MVSAALIASRSKAQPPMSAPAEPIAIASDHAGFALKEILKAELVQLGFGVLDLGPDSEASVDYPDYANALAGALEQGQAKRGVLICGSGIGISIAANRHRHIRAALIHDGLGARLCREHNDANVLALGARLIGVDVAKDCLKVFLTTDFAGGRHQNRVAKLG
jgi:ribose 5-phosphate isomerase B